MRRASISPVPGPALALLGATLGLLVPRCSCHSSPAGLGAASDGGTPGGNGARDGNRPPAETLVLAPAAVRLETNGTTPARQAFTVTARLQDGTSRNVTAESVFALADPNFGTMDGPEFISGLTGGQTVVSATDGTTTATASITVVVATTRVVPPPSGGSPVPNDPGPIVDRAPPDPARAPKLVYPNDGVLVPPNLNTLEIHFRKGSDRNTLFELSFSSPYTDVKVYTRCTPLGEGCLYQTDAAVWAAMAASNRGGAPVAIQVRGTDDQGSGVGTSSSVAVNFAAVPLQGGLYYWTTSAPVGVMRVDFGAAQQAPERFFPFSGNDCYGCHALSRNGERMTISYNGQYYGQLSLVDVGGRRVLAGGPASSVREQFQTWNPSSDQFAGVWSDGAAASDVIRIHDGRTAAVTATITIDGEPDHPDWSPLGDRIIFTYVTRHQTSQRPWRGGISYVKQLPGGGWSSRVELVPPVDSTNHYYPAYAPDARFFVYDVSVCNTPNVYDRSCDADSNSSARIFAMASDGGAPVLLARANAPGPEDEGNTSLTNTFPKWAPFVDARKADGSGRVMWLTFSSRRAYGLRGEQGSNLLIWMVAVDPDAILAGKDGSYPAFALPFQDLATSNHIAQWTAKVVTTTTDGGTSGDGSACRPAGDTCNPSGDECCAGTLCQSQGAGVYLCRPSF